MWFFRKLREPVFLEKPSSELRKLKQLQAINRSLLPEKLARQLAEDIRTTDSGIKGENSIKFELQNSHIPMYVLRGIYLEYGDSSAQIDFLVITRRRIFVIESKYYYGNIEINEKGDFIWHKLDGEEGIYSPDTQNRRHMDLIKLIRSEVKGRIAKILFEKYFFDNYRSVIVFANEKTILDDKYAPKDIKSRVIRADALIRYIRQENEYKGATDRTDKEMKSLARFYLNAHKERELDYTEKYSSANISRESKASSFICSECGETMVAKRNSKDGSYFAGCPNYRKGCSGPETYSLE